MASDLLDTIAPSPNACHVSQSPSTLSPIVPLTPTTPVSPAGRRRLPQLPMLATQLLPAGRYPSHGMYSPRLKSPVGHMAPHLSTKTPITALNVPEMKVKATAHKTTFSTAAAPITALQIPGHKNTANPISAIATASPITAFFLPAINSAVSACSDSSQMSLLEKYLAAQYVSSDDKDGQGRTNSRAECLSAPMSAQGELWSPVEEYTPYSASEILSPLHGDVPAEIIDLPGECGAQGYLPVISETEASTNSKAVSTEVECAADEQPLSDAFSKLGARTNPQPESICSMLSDGLGEAAANAAARDEHLAILKKSEVASAETDEEHDVAGGLLPVGTTSAFGVPTSSRVRSASSTIPARLKDDAAPTTRRKSVSDLFDLLASSSEVHLAQFSSTRTRQAGHLSTLAQKDSLPMTTHVASKAQSPALTTTVNHTPDRLEQSLEGALSKNPPLQQGPPTSQSSPKCPTSPSPSPPSTLETTGLHTTSSYLAIDAWRKGMCTSDPQVGDDRITLTG